MKIGYVQLFGLILGSLVIGHAYSQTDTDYLKSLEGEASELNLDDQTKKNSAAPAGAASDANVGSQGGGGAIEALEPGLTIEQFEQVLKSNYIGSYFFYKRLENDQKDQIYVFYQSNPDPKMVRDEILKISKK